MKRYLSCRSVQHFESGESQVIFRGTADMLDFSFWFKKGDKHNFKPGNLYTMKIREYRETDFDDV